MAPNSQRLDTFELLTNHDLLTSNDITPPTNSPTITAASDHYFRVADASTLIHIMAPCAPHKVHVRMPNGETTSAYATAELA